MNALLLGLLLVRQDPNPPDVLLPAGWRVDYRSFARDSKAYLVGPKGEQIEFPAYGSEGDKAAELRGADAGAVFTYAYLDDRRVDVAIGHDGRLVVSYPEAYPSVHSSFASFDYHTKVASAHEAATDLLILLTRIEAYKGSGYGSPYRTKPPQPAVPFFFSVWMGDPLGRMSIPVGYGFRLNKGASPIGWFECQGKPTVVALPADPAPVHSSKWEEVRTILGREFHIAEDDHGGLAAWVVPSPSSEEKEPGPIFTASQATPQSAVALILMRLSFQHWEH